MKLLFDQNLSHRLVRMLADVYPDCIHIRDVSLKTATDSVIWEYAKHNGYMIVSKDSDFHQRSFVFGYPPKVVWIRRGNCSTKTIEQILRDHHETVAQFEADATATFLILL
jgi:predicted nuclease of predicted toxin-antitoxin system